MPTDIGEALVVLVREGKFVLGVAYEDRKDLGQIPFMSGDCYAHVYNTFEQATADAAKCNRDIGLTDDQVFQIIRSSMTFHFPRRFRK